MTSFFTRTIRGGRFWRLAALLAVMGGLAGGCATTEGEGDLPWAKPEPWEGSIGIPGLGSDR